MTNDEIAELINERLWAECQIILPLATIAVIAEALRARIPADDGWRQLAEAGVQAAQTHITWIERERQGPLYPYGMKRDSPGGEEVWRAWWNDQIQLCQQTEDECRAVLALPAPPSRPEGEGE